jgi:SAM-dependent methyltransferase
VKLIADLQKLKPAPARLLDVGCDKGFFLDEARRHGYRVFGVEPSESGRNYCKRIGIDVVDDLAKRQETFDVATMHHVLEHIPYPVELLQEINRHLAPGGVLMIRVPDFATVWRKIFRTRWKWFQPEAHYFHYTSASLRKLLERTGFEVIRMQSQRPNTPQTMRSNRLANRTFHRYLGMEIPLRRRLSRAYEDLVGIELYAVAVKRD